ncbi:unnamed protein product [Allacma fusca]|uniref:RCC1-like domain-containing protein n=1 Tax=Allacma fusca TaxID=39272 RepID=A0A8J2LSL7_9HEXA|nr:unnamed protein product [Allacma fusca]
MTAKRIKLVEGGETLAGTGAVEGTVYMFGMGDIGQLGISAEKRKFPALVPELPNGGKEGVQVQCGGTHTVVLLKDGTVYTYGNNDDFALGRDTPDEEDMKEPGKVELKGKVVQVTAGDSHSAALTADGEVYLWGNFRDSNGFMGLIPGNEKKSVKSPVLLTLFKSPGEAINIKITKIASGSNHLIMLGEDNHIYTCGCGEQGQLGRQKLRSSSRRTAGSNLSDKDYMLTPLLVRTLGAKKVIEIWAGDFTTYCKVKSGPVWVFGLNNYGQLGVEPEPEGTEPTILVPVKSGGLLGNNWVQISAGEHHALALDADGKVHSLGRNQDGRLGLGPTHESEQTIWVATAVPRLENDVCVQIACGLSTSYAIKKNKNQVFAWGFGVNYQLATGDDEDQTEPTPCKFSIRDDTLENVVYLSAGAQHVGLIRSETVAQENHIDVPELKEPKRKTAKASTLQRTASTKRAKK